MIELRRPTDRKWIDIVLSNFDAFLVDHAACERKASAVGLSFVVRYPDRTELIEPMILFAREELEHFHQVCKLILERGIRLEPDTKDEYANALQKEVRTGREERLLDRLITASVIEARGFERLQLITDELTEPPLKSAYQRMARAEGQHKDFFVKLARHYFNEVEIKTRLDRFLELEAEIIDSLPLRPAVH